VVVRVAGDGDLAALASLRSLWPSEGSPEEPDLEGRIATWLADDRERRTSWLAESGGEPIGMASLFEYRRMPRPGRLNSRWGYVSNMFVREDFRNQGIGAALLAALIDVAEERSYVRLVVSPSNDALSLYRRVGFLLPGSMEGADVLLVRPGAPR
jgi:GNAT superfamily N-acetyltransferase